MVFLKHTIKAKVGRILLSLMALLVPFKGWNPPFDDWRWKRERTVSDWKTNF